MNAQRIASLLRELADAFEEEPKLKRKKRAITAPSEEPSKETVDAVRRALRKGGVAA